MGSMLSGLGARSNGLSGVFSICAKLASGARASASSVMEKIFPGEIVFRADFLRNFNLSH